MTAAVEHLGPTFPFAPATRSAWRETALTRIAELHTLTVWVQTRPGAGSPELAATIKQHLEVARDAASASDRARPAGADVERVMTNLDAAEADLLRLAPLDYLLGQMPGVLMHVRRHLPKTDPRRTRVEALATQSELTSVDQDVVIGAMRGASTEARRELARVRSFTNLLLATAFVLTLAVGGIALLGIAVPDVVPVCFKQGQSPEVCPTGAHAGRWDLLLIELVGMVSAAVVGAAALRGIRGTSTPFSLPVAVAVLKLPTGALTALLGLLLMRGQFVPGLSALDSPGQIVAWAIIFGSAQQLFTRLVDQQAHTVLDDVRGTKT